jgi:FAD/FMN-containing dehydrogenase
VHPFFESNFLLDQLPNWKLMFRRGFVESEILVPAARAAEVFSELIRLTHRRNDSGYLTAVKAHRRDSFLVSFALDGYSLGMDIPINPRRSGTLARLLQEMNDIAVENGGLAFLAKDTTLTPWQARAMYAGWDEFVRWKRELDPHEVFQSNQYRRLFREGQ